MSSAMTIRHQRGEESAKVGRHNDNNNDDMLEGRVQIHTRITIKTKARWEKFLQYHHGTRRGAYGPELERAILYYLDNFSPDASSLSSSAAATAVNAGRKMNRSTMTTLKILSAGLRVLPGFPLIKPAILRTVIKNHIQADDRRTVSKYHKIVVKYAREVDVPGNIFPEWDVEGFCMYVDRLLTEGSLKW